jgi:hypothetical protein
MAFAAPVYGIVNVTAMNYIIYYNEFLFPRLGPIEAHITYALIALLSMVIGSDEIFSLFGIGIKAADIIIFVGLIPMYYEMIRLQIQLFKRLKADEK